MEKYVNYCQRLTLNFMAVAESVFKFHKSCTFPVIFLYLRDENEFKLFNTTLVQKNNLKLFQCLQYSR